ncbi:MAG: SPASM domain-containing protein [Deltaproteobacteria bacterium]|nr:SPASM domain-containing protein [Deltaproteobacteria bacterium]
MKKLRFRAVVNICCGKFYTLKRLPEKVANQPLWAQIEITNVCNLRCKMCAQATDKWRKDVPPKTLSLAGFKEIIDQIPYINMALMNGVGEPLLNPNLVDMIDYAHSKGINTQFFTNATLLSPEMSRRLINVEGLMRIRVSLDAGTAEKFDEIRKGASFVSVCENIAGFIKIRAELGRKRPEIVVCLVPMKENIRDIPSLISTLANIGVKALSIGVLLTNQDTGTEPVSAEDIVLIEGYVEMAKAKGINLTYRKEAPNKGPHTRTCAAPWTYVFVNVAGWINPCCFSFVDKGTYFGNIHEKSLREIWNSDGYKAFIHELKTAMPEVCREYPVHSDLRP